jgi:prephenate dehydrogenase
VLAENPTLRSMNMNPVVGIVGSQGAYGRWLGRFLAERMGLTVIGRDPAGDTALGELELIEAADVLLFSAPIRLTAAVVEHYTALADGRERGRLWLDVTSIKRAPVAALLASQAEVVGLHPMAAPPKAPTLKGRVLIVCEARLQRWRPWLQRLLVELQAECVQAGPEQHDELMALVQAMVHATHLAQVAVLRQAAPWVRGPQDVLPFRSVSFELDMTIGARVLASNPAIYEDIQFCNPAVGPVLQRMIDALARLRDCVEAGDDGRQRFRDEFLGAGRAFFGDAELARGDYGFERLGYLLADLAEPGALSVHLPQDRPGALRALLAIFERHGVNLGSIHSSRTPAGEVHFRIGYPADTAAAVLQQVRDEIAASGCGIVLGDAP